MLRRSGYPLRMTETSMHIYKVGGAVRDRLLGRPVTEIDWVVVLSLIHI